MCQQVPVLLGTSPLLPKVCGHPISPSLLSKQTFWTLIQSRFRLVVGSSTTSLLSWISCWTQKCFTDMSFRLGSSPSVSRTPGLLLRVRKYHPDGVNGEAKEDRRCIPWNTNGQHRNLWFLYCSFEFYYFMLFQDAQRALDFYVGNG